MLQISFTPKFQRMLKKLEPALRDEVRENIALLENPANHQHLRVHKLQGRFGSVFSFSVNYRTRVIFEYENESSVILEAVGSHDIYR